MGPTETTLRGRGGAGSLFSQLPGATGSCPSWSDHCLPKGPPGTRLNRWRGLGGGWQAWRKRRSWVPAPEARWRNFDAFYLKCRGQPAPRAGTRAARRAGPAGPGPDTQSEGEHQARAGGSGSGSGPAAARWRAATAATPRRAPSTPTGTRRRPEGWRATRTRTRRTTRPPSRRRSRTPGSERPSPQAAARAPARPAGRGPGNAAARAGASQAASTRLPLLSLH